MKDLRSKTIRLAFVLMFKVSQQMWRGAMPQLFDQDQVQVQALRGVRKVRQAMSTSWLGFSQEKK